MSAVTRSWTLGTVPTLVQWQTEFDFMQPLKVQITSSSAAAASVSGQQEVLRVSAVGALSGVWSAQYSGATAGRSAFTVAAAGTSLGWPIGLLFTDADGSAPISSTGKLLAANNTIGSISVSYGLDLRGFTFANAAFVSQGFSISPTGAVAAAGLVLPVGVGVPATAGATGVAGTVLVDSAFLYVCVATNTWKRAALSTW